MGTKKHDILRVGIWIGYRRPEAKSKTNFESDSKIT